MREIEKLNELLAQKKGVRALADHPNERSRYGVGDMTAAELKAWLDQVQEALLNKLNELITKLQSENGAGYIGFGTEDLETIMNAVETGEFAAEKLKVKASATAETYTFLQNVINLLDARMVTVEGEASASYITVTYDKTTGVMTLEKNSGETIELDLTAVTATIADGAVTTAKIADGAVTTAKIYGRAVTTEKIDNEAVTNAKIADGAVTEAKIYDGAVKADKIGTSAVTNDKINPGAVTAEKIGSGAVLTEKLAAGAVTTDKIASSAVTTGKIADGAVTAAKLNDGAVLADTIAYAAVTREKLATELKNTIASSAEAVEEQAVELAAVRAIAEAKDASLTFADIAALSAWLQGDATKQPDYTPEDLKNGWTLLSRKTDEPDWWWDASIHTPGTVTVDGHTYVSTYTVGDVTNGGLQALEYKIDYTRLDQAVTDAQAAQAAAEAAETAAENAQDAAETAETGAETAQTAAEAARAGAEAAQAAAEAARAGAEAAVASLDIGIIVNEDGLLCIQYQEE